MKYSEISGDFCLVDTAPSNLLDGAVELLPSADAQRQSLRVIYMTALVRKNAGLPDVVVDETMNELTKVPGVEIIEDRSFTEDFGYRCAEYSFGTVNQEPWAQRFIPSITPQFWRSPEKFLGENGYQKTVEPTAGDIVAYGGIENGQIWFGHFGIYEGLGKVVSKFGRGPVLRHDASVIPKSFSRRECHWGDYMWHFTKTES